MKHLKKFLSAATYQEYIMGGGYDVPNVSYIEKTGDVYFIPNTYENMYLTTEATTNGTITFTIGKSVSTDSLSSVAYSVDNGETWTTTQNANSTQKTVIVNVSKGDKVLWKGTGTRTGTNNASTSAPYISYFGGTAFFKTYGNAMSLLNGDNFQSVTTVNNYHFKRLFCNSKCVNAKHLILPATTLARYCYYYMFDNCTSLIKAPALPATALAGGCYDHMFYGCTSLINAPALPATALAGNCYYYMFCSCTSLVSAPALPATTLASSCYYYMFDNCTSLINAPALPATTLVSNCYNHMFYNCTSLINAPALPATTLVVSCYDCMFYGCTSLVSAPALPATTLVDYCYSQMFRDCTNLVSAPALPATTLARYCYRLMFHNCTSLINAPALPATTLVTDCYKEMFRGCRNLQRIECMATNAKSDFTESWVYGVAETGVFVGNASSTWVSGQNGVPNGWSTNVTIIQTPESNGTLGIYIDDFPEGIYESDGYDNIYDWLSDEYGGDYNDYFELCGDQIEYNGVTYYAWIFGGGGKPHSVQVYFNRNKRLH